MVSWTTIQTFLVPLGIWALRNGPNYYHSLRASYNSRKSSIHPAPPRVSRALNILFLVAITALLSTLPYFSPPNLFATTASRLQTSTDVIYTRLSALRALTPLDLALRSHLPSKDFRLLYFAYGPSATAHCPFCTPSDPRSYLYYALPSLLAPHIAHLAVLGLVTSALFSGRAAARWRSHATVAGIAIAAADLYLTVTYDYKANTRATRAEEIDFFFWRMRVYRGVCVAGVDGVLGWVMWLAATGRFFGEGVTVADRLEAVGKAVEVANFRLWATGNVRNAVVRDRGLMQMVGAYWMEEKELYEEREVVDGIKRVLGRINVPQLAQMAGSRADQALGALEPPQGMPP